MAFGLVQTFRTKPQKYNHFPGGGLGLYLIIKHPAAESRVLRFLARAVLLALLIVSLPYFGSILRGSSIASQSFLKNGILGSDNDIGVVSFQLTEDTSAAFREPNDYRIVYLKQFDSTLAAVKKTEDKTENKAPARRRLFSYESSDAKRAALDKLEDVLLEPPRAASGKSRRYLQRTRYLPDLMGDSLEGYPRHVFIDIGLPEKEGGSGTGWFAKNYPTRNKKFEMYKIETVSTDQESLPKVPQVGISDWLVKNVRPEEYVVMKADAEVVEEMMKSKVIRLVDELFLECKPQSHSGRKVNGSRRAYWQCLALYGQLRDEGVAVHQWWG